MPTHDTDNSTPDNNTNNRSETLITCHTATWGSDGIDPTKREDAPKKK